MGKTTLFTFPDFVKRQKPWSSSQWLWEERHTQTLRRPSPLAAAPPTGTHVLCPDSRSQRIQFTFALRKHFLILVHTYRVLSCTRLCAKNFTCTMSPKSPHCPHFPGEELRCRNAPRATHTDVCLIPKAHIESRPFATPQLSRTHTGTKRGQALRPQGRSAPSQWFQKCAMSSLTRAENLPGAVSSPTTGRSANARRFLVTREVAPLRILTGICRASHTSGILKQIFPKALARV